MSNPVFRLPRYYQDDPQVSKLERVLEGWAEGLRVSEPDTLAQLWISTATRGLNLWKQWAELPVDRTRPCSYRGSHIKTKLRGQGATTAEILRSVTVSFGYDVSLASVVEHPEEYQFETILPDLAPAPSDMGGIEAAVNETKPVHPDYWFAYELAQLPAALRVGGGLWSVQAVILPPMEEEQHVRIYHYYRRQGPAGPGAGGGRADARRGVDGQGRGEERRGRQGPHRPT